MRYVMIGFVFLGWAFYELSGGDEFDPEQTRLSRIDEPVAVEETALAKAPEATATVVASSVTTEAAAFKTASVPAADDTTDSTPPVTKPILARAEPEESATLVAAVVEEAEEQQTIILPSLVANTPVVSQVSFSSDGTSTSEIDTVDAGIANEIRFVTGSRVNVRGGPGTSFSVVNKLVKGDEVEILQNPGDGWVKLRPLDGGPVGWMADFLLSES